MKKLFALACALGLMYLFFQWGTFLFSKTGPYQETVGNLSALRSAVDLYHREHHAFPAQIGDLIPHYILEMPEVHVMHHSISTKILNLKAVKSIDDSGGWAYVSNPQDADFGKVLINCTHSSARGVTLNLL